jgi:hypothetical protein
VLSGATVSDHEVPTQGMSVAWLATIKVCPFSFNLYPIRLIFWWNTNDIEHIMNRV